MFSFTEWEEEACEYNLGYHVAMGTLGQVMGLTRVPRGYAQGTQDLGALGKARIMGQRHHRKITPR